MIWHSFLSYLALLSFLAAWVPTPDLNRVGKLSPDLAARLETMPDEAELLPVIVIFTGSLPQPPSRQGKSAPERLIRDLQAETERSQNALEAILGEQAAAGEVADVHSLWIVNGISLRASADVIEAIAARSDVARVELDRSHPAPSLGPSAGQPWDNLGRINTPQVWALGFRGQGVVVANLDTGVDLSHPELQAAWRGGSNSWFDPYGEHAVPSDLPAGCAARGHGTGTMGVMAGQTVGVAPGAQWIGVKIFADNCAATDTGILLGLQWLLDPDGDPATDDAPQVANSSWGGDPGICLPTYQTALQNLRAAGILPVFSAGNYGPALGSGAAPATNPEAFPVGASDRLDQVYNRSSRGPNRCQAPAGLFPALAAPGVDILTAGLNGELLTRTGTSFAAPHAAGALALLLSALPEDLTVDQQAQALTVSTLDLGAPGPDNESGFGRLDVLAALHSLLPNKLSLEAEPLLISEDSGPVSLTLRLQPPADFPVTVSFAADGTAEAGSDFLLPGPVTFFPGEEQRVVPFEILADQLSEPEETVLLRLSQPVNGIPAAGGGEALLTIRDDDCRLYLPNLLR